MNQDKARYIDGFIGNFDGEITAKELYESILDLWGSEALVMENGYKITYQDLQTFIEKEYNK
jgi:hypothetical protein